MARTHITDDDKGKKVMDAHGEEIGMVSDVRDGTAFVEPDPGMGDQLMAKLGWDDADKSDYMLDDGHIDQVTDDGIHLRGDM